MEQLCDRRACRARAAYRHGAILKLFADAFERIHHRREHHDRRAVLIIVENGNVAALLEPAFYLEASRRGDILKIDAAEAARKKRNGVDYLIGIL